MSFIPPSRVHGFILCGGQSRRFKGRDKGLIDLHGRPLASHVKRSMQHPLRDLHIITNRNQSKYKRIHLQLLSDCLSGFKGPLAGIHTALSAINRNDYALIVPCDSPFVSKQLLHRLLQAISANNSIVIAHDGKRPQPLFMLIQAKYRNAIARELHRNKLSVVKWLDTTPHVSVDCSDISDTFINMNRFSDLRPYAR